MGRLVKKGKTFALKSLGYREYQGYLQSLKKNDLVWSDLNDIEGKIAELKTFPNFSVFGLKDKKSDTYGQKLLLTDVDLDKITGHNLCRVSDWRIKKATAQRVFYLSLCNSVERLDRLRLLDTRKKQLKIKKIFFKALEGDVAYDFKDFGYRTRFSKVNLSRDELITNGIYTRIGKYYRSPLCLAPMPDSSGSVDSICTAAFAHMLAVIPRNFEFKNPSRQLKFAESVLKKINSFPRVAARVVAERNVCAAIGVGADNIKRFSDLYGIGIRSFRLYSIATDLRLILMVKSLIDEIMKLGSHGRDIEFFVGQITSIDQFDVLCRILGPSRWDYIDGFFLGNGGGSRCKTAETGMIVNTPQVSYLLRNHPKLAGKSIIIEGGVGNEPAVALLLGASGLSYSAGITGGCIEAPGGALYITDSRGYWKPYRGEASPSAKIIEGHIYQTGDAKQVEGANGFIRMEKKYPSMCGRILNLNEWLAQSLVKLGVSSIDELHALGAAPLSLRSEAQRNVAKAYGVGDKIQASEALDLDYTVRIT